MVASIVYALVVIIAIVAIVYAIIDCLRKAGTAIPSYARLATNDNLTSKTPDSMPTEDPPAFHVIPDSQVNIATMERFFINMEKEKPIRFSPEQIARFTKNCSTRLGSGGYGVVYKGEFHDGVQVAVKVLNNNSIKRIEEQFMAEVSTLGRTYHTNLVRLYGFCFDPTMRALVYEFMENGSLNGFLFDEKRTIEWEKLHEIAIGTARGLAYLHEECHQRIIHYDIKPENVLLDADDDQGPFFDLEFAVPDDEDGDGANDDYGSNSGDEDEEEDNDSVVIDGEREFNFTVSSSSSGGRSNPNLALSPSDDLFFKGRLVPLESSSVASNASESNSKPQFPVSLLKSATKFRVFMLGFKKPKSATEKADTNDVVPTATPKQHQPTQTQQQQQQQQQQQGKFTVKFKVEEVPIISLFSRDNSSRNSSSSKQQKQNPEDAASDDKRFSKDVMQKYLKMIKPLYIRVSRRYGEKLRFSGQLSLGSGKTASATPAAPVSSPTKAAATKNDRGTDETETPVSNPKNQKQGALPAGLREVCKHLGKSRSASSAVAAVPPAPFRARRRDDSLLQQQDGIQGAILHCKRSFNSSRDSETSLLPLSTSDPSNEKSIGSSRNSSKELKDALV